MSIDVKGLVREFILIVVLYLLDIGTEFGCYSEIQVSRKRYQKWLIYSDGAYHNNITTGFKECISADWDRDEFELKVESYAAITDAYLFFLVISGSVFVCYLLVYLWFVFRACHRPEYIEENRERVIRVKFTFGFILSFVLDIPGSCMSVVLYSMRHGARGLHCWDCAQDPECVKKQELEHRQYISGVAVVLMFFGLLIVSLWKGVTTFYRWSKTDKADCWQLRGCVALFVGTYFVVIILTPALGIFKYMFFRLPSEKENVFAQFTDSLFMIGMLGWIVFMVVGCCFPLLKWIRIGSPTILTGVKNETA